MTVKNTGVIGVYCAIGQRDTAVAQVIGLGIAWHMSPVDTTHILTPAQNLPDKALGCGQRRAAFVPSGLRAGHHFTRIEHFGVQCE